MRLPLTKTLRYRERRSGAVDHQIANDLPLERAERLEGLAGVVKVGVVRLLDVLCDDFRRRERFIFALVVLLRHRPRAQQTRPCRSREPRRTTASHR